jgi:hypothetical protein
MRRLLALAMAASLAWVMQSPAHATTPTCFGEPADVVLTNGDDNYTVKTTDHVVIWAGGGNDVVWGPDPYEYGHHNGLIGVYICGGPGNDRLKGGLGNDKINGGDGADNISDWQGADLLQGNAGNDRVVDESCEDCDTWHDVLRGQGGDDVLVNAWGNDKVYGGPGADDLIDIECDSTYLDGGPGFDYIESFHGSYEGTNCDYYDATGHIVPGPADTVIGGTETDRGLLSRADKTTGVERITMAAPEPCWC